MSPRQLSNKLLDNCLVNICLGKRPHREKISSRKAMHLRELRPQILGQPLDHLRSPTLLTLATQDPAANVPVQQNQLTVDRQNRSHLCRTNTCLQVGQQRCIA